MSRSLVSPARFSDSVGSFDTSYRWCSPRCPPPPAQNGSRSPGANGWRITGMSVPGIVSSQARPSGFGNRMKSANAGGTGIVVQRFDHIDSGKLSASGARAYLRRPSVTCTQLPNTPPIAQSRIDVGLAGEQRHHRSAVGAMRRFDTEDVGDRGVEVDVGGERVDVARRHDRASGRTAACGRAARTAGRPACPRCRRRLSPDGPSPSSPR